MRTEEREALRNRRLATIRRMAEAGEDVHSIKEALGRIDKATWQTLRAESEASGVVIQRPLSLNKAAKVPGGSRG